MKSISIDDLDSVIEVIVNVSDFIPSEKRNRNI